MPMLPKRKCIELSCPAFARKGDCRCDRHAIEYLAKYKARSKETAALYSLSAWKCLRDDHLTRQPFCVECMKEGRYTMATDVDHVIPHKGRRDLFFDPSNLQSLCHACHARKTATEDGGFGHSQGGRGV